MSVTLLIRLVIPAIRGAILQERRCWAASIERVRAPWMAATRISGKKSEKN